MTKNEFKLRAIISMLEGSKGRLTNSDVRQTIETADKLANLLDKDSNIFM